MLLIPKLGLGYQFIPKVATTSMFNWLYKAHGKATQNNPDNANYKRDFFKERYKVDSLNDIRRAKGTYLRIALTRDPVLRFLSLYGNRVIAKRALDIDSKDAKRMLNAGLSLNPQLHELIDSLDGYLAASRSISHHARRQSELLGPDLSIYDHLLDISDAGLVPDLIRHHWRARGLHEALANADEELPRLQTAGPKIGLEGLSHRSFERLLEHFQPDYDAIPTLNQDFIKAEFVRNDGGSRVFFFDFERRQSPKPEARKRLLSRFLGK